VIIVLCSYSIFFYKSTKLLNDCSEYEAILLTLWDSLGWGSTECLIQWWLTYILFHINNQGHETSIIVERLHVTSFAILLGGNTAAVCITKAEKSFAKQLLSLLDSNIFITWFSYHTHHLHWFLEIGEVKKYTYDDIHISIALMYMLHISFVYAIGSDKLQNLSPKSSSTLLLLKLKQNNYYFKNLHN